MRIGFWRLSDSSIGLPGCSAFTGSRLSEKTGRTCPDL